MSNGTAPNAKRLLWAGFFSIFAAGVGFGVRGSILADWAHQFGFTQTEFLSIKGRHFRCEMYDPYNILNSSPLASDAELKTQYHKLVADTHPDRLIARGVPAEFIEIATKKLAAINAAYEEIKTSRRTLH